MNAPVDRLGNFDWKNVNSGNYVVKVFGGGAQSTFLKSATLGGRDIATGFTASGSGNINDTVNLPVGATITYTLIANIASGATGTLVNTATVTAPARRARR